MAAWKSWGTWAATKAAHPSSHCSKTSAAESAFVAFALVATSSRFSRTLIAAIASPLERSLNGREPLLDLGFAPHPQGQLDHLDRGAVLHIRVGVAQQRDQYIRSAGHRVGQLSEGSGNHLRTQLGDALAELGVIGFPLVYCALVHTRRR